MENPIRRFAFRVTEIRTDKRWQEPPAGQFRRPPREWREASIVQDWAGWDSTRQGADRVWQLPMNTTIRNRGSSSIVWDPSIQRFFFAPLDCTQEDAQAAMRRDHLKDWSTIYFRELLPGAAYVRPGIYKVLEHGTNDQLPFECPGGFDEYIPKTAFRRDATSTPQVCHLVGDLSLVLALHAMCPEDIANIPQQIRDFFLQANQPRFVPWTEHRQYFPRDKDTYPERAFVVQTALIVNPTASEQTLAHEEKVLSAWEAGRYGPMVSSSPPTGDQLREWLKYQQQAEQQRPTQQHPLPRTRFAQREQ